MHAPRQLRLPWRGRLLVAGVAVLALAGCNGGAAGLAAQSATVLHERVAAVRAAADTDDRDAAIAAVDAFRAEVQRLVDAGELTQAEAAGLLAHADAIAADVLAEVVAPTPEPTPEPTPSPEPTLAPEPAISPEQVQVLQQETADRLAEMLRERLTEYVKQKVAEEKAQAQREKDERIKERRDRKAERGGSR
jgi:hypothetical protein